MALQSFSNINTDHRTWGNNKGEWLYSLLVIFFSKNVTASFNCEHAHVVDKMADIATASARREKQLSLQPLLRVVIRKLISSSVFMTGVQHCRS